MSISSIVLSWCYARIEHPDDAIVKVKVQTSCCLFDALPDSFSSLLDFVGVTYMRIEGTRKSEASTLSCKSGFFHTKYGGIAAW